MYTTSIMFSFFKRRGGDTRPCKLVKMEDGRLQLEYKNNSEPGNMNDMEEREKNEELKPERGFNPAL